MNKGTLKLGVLAALLTLANLAQAQNQFPVQLTGHYPAGAEGIKAASLPPEGLYLRDYNLFYSAGINKSSFGLSDFDANVYVQAPRLIYMTDWKIPFLGAQYGADILVPFYYSEVKIKSPAGTVKDSTFAMGDLQFEPLLLAWHGKQYDLGAGYAFWAPTGDSDKDGTRFSRLLGKGFWGHMLTFGGTYYPTEDKTWALSVLNRYEFNMRNDDLKVTPGQQLTVEWGVSKTIMPNIDIGAVGYYVQQTSQDHPDFNSPVVVSHIKDRVFAAGPEISTFCPKLGLFASLRYLREFGAKDGPEGNKVVLTLTKRW